MSITSDYIPGLQGVVAAQTRMSKVEGQLGQLTIGGFPLEEIAGNADFDELTYLLWNDELPTASHLADFRAEIAARSGLPKATIELLREVAAAKAPVMDALRMGVGSLSVKTAPLADYDEQLYSDALTLIANIPAIVGAYWRLLDGKEPVESRPGLGYAANYLWMLFGEEPSTERARGLATYLNTVSDHGLNASTFTARVIVSTGSDLISAITGAIGALKGPLHGGAPGPALDMVFEIGEAANAEPWLREKLEAGERLMGFGHRVYKVRDPRADVLGTAAEKLFTSGGDMALYDLAKYVEGEAVRLLEEYKPGRNLQTNVEFYTALLLHGVGLSTDLFSPTFAVGRTAGWTAHCFEQVEGGRLLRPRAEYIGETEKQWVPLEDRG